jgi:hypothetical protein
VAPVAAVAAAARRSRSSPSTRPASRSPIARSRAAPVALAAGAVTAAAVVAAAVVEAAPAASRRSARAAARSSRRPIPATADAAAMAEAAAPAAPAAAVRAAPAARASASCSATARPSRAHSRRVLAQAASAAIHFISLGCAKNRVDTEVMLGVAGVGASRRRTRATPRSSWSTPAASSARQGRVGRHHPRDGRAQGAGAARSSSSPAASRSATPRSSRAEMPEVDHFLGSSDMLKLGDVLDGAAPPACSWATPPTGPSARPTRARSRSAATART